MMPDPLPSDDERGRVLRFRPRGASAWSGWHRSPQPTEQAEVDDLAEYERSDSDDDYRHRMIMNLLALAVTVMLIISGVWLTNKIMEVRKEQDCYLSGRRNCAPIEVPTRGQMTDDRRRAS
jgi:hypothetical protein